MAKIPTESYKGVRDFYPEDQFLLKWISEKMRVAAESFGFVEYHASILEPSELYRGKTSEEIVNEQTYSFVDRGGREVTLRPEMTPTVARMVADRRRELSFPLRWYSIPNVFRYERPQRGRLREHWQLNCDIFGASGVEAEVEIISLAYRLMKSFSPKIKDGDFEIRINNRKMLDSVLDEKLSLTPQEKKEVLRILDGAGKNSSWKENLSDLVGEEKKQKLMDFFDADENLLTAWWSKEEIARYYKIFDGLNELGIKNFKPDRHLVRGFDYYTGMVFEVFDTNPQNNRSLFGGGRYDNLLKDLFDEEGIPVVGFGMGDTVLIDFLETRGLTPPYESSTKLFIATVDPALIVEAEKLAQTWREDGLNVAINLGDKKVGDQLKSADKQKIPYVVVLGEDELKNQKIAVKKLSDGSEKTISFDEAPRMIKD